MTKYEEYCAKGFLAVNVDTYIHSPLFKGMDLSDDKVSVEITLVTLAVKEACEELTLISKRDQFVYRKTFEQIKAYTSIIARKQRSDDKNTRKEAHLNFLIKDTRKEDLKDAYLNFLIKEFNIATTEEGKDELMNTFFIIHIPEKKTPFERFVEELKINPVLYKGLKESLYILNGEEND